MTAIGPCKYNADGRLYKPDQYDVNRAFPRTVYEDETGFSFDSGQYHVVMLRSAGRSFDEASRRAGRKYHRFFDEAEFVPGFRKISVEKKRDYIYCAQNTVIIYKIVYAVERPARIRRVREAENPFVAA